MRVFKNSSSLCIANLKNLIVFSTIITKKNMNLIILLSIFLSFSSYSNSQTPVFEEGSVTFSKDTVCAKYVFYPRDTLVYSVQAFDSISTNYEAPLLRNRKEIIMFIVDSIDADFRYHISRYLMEYNAIESNSEAQNNLVNNHPWVKKKVSIVIDQFGKRYSYSTPDSTKAIVSPAGPFAPFLFFDLGLYCNQVDINWNVRSNIEVPENGIPFPLFNCMTLYKFREPVDTLGQKVNRIELIRTGQGSYEYPHNNQRATITSKTNEFGLLDISILDNVPIHYFVTKEVKVNINQNDGYVIPGYNFYTQYYTLERFSSPKRLELLNESNIEMPKPSKKTKK